MATSKVWLVVPALLGMLLVIVVANEIQNHFFTDDTFSDITESIEDIVPKQQPTGQKIIDGTHDQEKADALFKIINEKRNWYGSGSVSYDSKISKQAIIAAKWYDENGPARGDQHHDPLLYTCPPIRDTSSYTAGEVVSWMPLTTGIVYYQFDHNAYADQAAKIWENSDRGHKKLFTDPVIFKIGIGVINSGIQITTVVQYCVN
tara:strand:- start:67 stop:678 length:612 start_codon:yes stop_codon:yes gene_type:complete